MKKNNLKSVLAWLLTLCLLLGGVAALAEGVTVTDGAAAGEVVVTVPDVSGAKNEGVDVTADRDGEKEVVRVEVNGEYNTIPEADRAKVDAATTLTVNAGSVSEVLPKPVEHKWTETTEDGEVIEHTDESSYVYAVEGYISEEATNRNIVINAGSVTASVNVEGVEEDDWADAYGVAARNYSSTSTLEENIVGDVTATVTTQKVEASASAVDTNAWDGGKLTVNVTGDISADATATDASAYSYGANVYSGEKASSTLNVEGDVSATVNANTRDTRSTGVNVNSNEGGEATVTVKGNIDAANNSTYVRKDENDWSGAAEGVEVYADANSKANLAVEGNIAAHAKGDSSAQAASITAYGGEAKATLTGNLSADGVNWTSGVNVNASNAGEWVEEDGFERFVPDAQKGSADVTVKGNVSAKASTEDNSIFAVNLSADDDSAATLTLAGDVTAANDKGQATGVSVSTSGGTAGLSLMGDVSAEGQQYVCGANVWAGDNSYWVTNEETKEEKRYGGDKKGTVDAVITGDVDAKISGDIMPGGNSASLTGLAVGTGNGGTTNLTMDGDINAVSTATDPRVTSQAISVSANQESTVNVTVVGDATATGVSSYGVRVFAAENATSNVLVDGTVHGDSAAFYATANGSFTDKDGNVTTSTEAYTTTNIYVWKAEPNAEGEIARVDDVTTVFTPYADGQADKYGNTGTYESTYTKNEEASNKLEAAIWYIVKVSEKWQGKLTATGTGTYAANGTTYDVAHQDDAVTLRFDVPSNKKLSAIYYSDGQKADYVKNDDGTYTIKMLSGGGMMLSLKFKDKEKKAEEKKTEEKKTEEKTEEKTETKTEEKKTEEKKTEAKTEEKTEEKTEAKTEEKGEETTEEKAEEKTEAKVEAPVDSKDENIAYEQVEETQEVNGVKAADKPEIEEALETVGESLDGEGETVTVSIPGAEKIMDEEELKTFDKLPVKDRLSVVLSALGFADESLGDVQASMSDDAKALSESIGERMQALPEEEKQALLSTIAEEFPKGTVTVDGKDYESFSIDLVIDRDGEKSYERYTFYNEDGAWKLYGIEKGEYQEA